jgi:hypothetical protein
MRSYFYFLEREDKLDVRISGFLVSLDEPAEDAVFADLRDRENLVMTHNIDSR